MLSRMEYCFKIIIFYFILHPEERMSCQSRKVFVFSGIEKNKEKQDVKNETRLSNYLTRDVKYILVMY